MSAISVELISTARPYSAVLVRTGVYPLPAGGAAASKILASALLGNAPAGGPSCAVFLQQQYMGNAKEEFNAHLRQWRPESGLGIWPDRPPPRLWKTSDLFRMALGQDVPLMYRVYRLDGARAAADAFNRIIGSSMVIAIAHTGSTDSLMQLYKNKYQSGITEPNLRILPFYVPLLDVKSIHHRNAAQLSDWLGSAYLYLRESPPDNGMLVITDLEIDPLLRSSGAKKDRPGVWRFEYRY